MANGEIRCIKHTMPSLEDTTDKIVPDSLTVYHSVLLVLKLVHLTNFNILVHCV